MKSLILWLAQGLGLGRIPWAPGTFGSLGGLLWFLLLLKPGSLWFFFLAALAGILLSVWICGEAEKILKLRDPGSIVLDEIIALPICFTPWVLSEWLRTGVVPAPEWFLQGRNAMVFLIIFVLFRIFDILKPWPVRQSQKFEGGWGVTADDVLAGCYVALLTLIVLV
jgi:phosphatidylglycerophosphatase A